MLISLYVYNLFVYYLLDGKKVLWPLLALREFRYIILVCTGIYFSLQCSKREFHFKTVWHRRFCYVLSSSLCKVFWNDIVYEVQTGHL
jgi:hypothetical protein